jgi:Helix-turn-helix of DDE superfamily endonuclease
MKSSNERMLRARELPEEDSYRLTGVHTQVFREMVAVYETRAKKAKGAPSPLIDSAQVMCALQYWRDYPTFFRLGFDWGVDESSAQRIVERVENALLKSGKFHLPGKKRIENLPVEPAVAVDVTESPIERPKKNKNNSTVSKGNATPSKRKSLSR